MHKLTKIVATIGPATETEQTIEQLLLAGMNVARFNTKHGTPEWHHERIARVKTVAQRMNHPVGVLLDLQGPEIRITIPGGQGFDVKDGEEVVFSSNEAETDPRKPMVPQMVIDSLHDGDSVLIDDGLGEFIITAKEGNLLRTRALNSCTVGNRKTMNTPGVVMEMPSLIEADLVHLNAATNDTVDYVGLSFVRNAHDIAILRGEMEKRGLNAAVVAKIENQAALDNLDEIIDAADAVMVARGDLAAEIPFQKLTYWQKQIILKSREKGKPVITATQMLKSMVDRPRPTRAEVSDVANAVYDGTDAVMLSEETTIGKFPVETVTTQATIVTFNEQYAAPPQLQINDSNASSYITHSAVALLKKTAKDEGELQIDRIICLTETGETARLLSRFRPGIPIEVLTSNQQTFRKLSLVYGINPHVVDLPGDRLESSEQLLQKIRDLHLAETGETVLLVHGTFWKKPGLTNTMAVLTL